MERKERMEGKEEERRGGKDRDESNINSFKEQKIILGMNMKRTNKATSQMKTQQALSMGM